VFALVLICAGLLVLLGAILFQTGQGALAQGGYQVDAPESVQTSGIAGVSKTGGLSSSVTDYGSVRLDVPLIMQNPELPTGCEATATAMMLQYAGSLLTKFDVVTKMPYSDDPSQGFVGNPYSDNGFTIYPSALMPLVYEQLGSAVDLTGAPLADLRAYLQAGKPVCCWIASDKGYVHCVVLTGFEGDTVYINDSLEGATVMLASEFEHLRANNAYRALSY
jgi:uncharacterized protein YvpB